jgi:hypothetical protein
MMSSTGLPVLAVPTTYVGSEMNSPGKEAWLGSVGPYAKTLVLVALSSSAMRWPPEAVFGVTPPGPCRLAPVGAAGFS